VALEKCTDFGVPFFIVGFSRSGTTLIAALLDKHSRICVTPETRFCRGVLPCGQCDRVARDHKFIGDRIFGYWRTSDLKIPRVAFDAVFSRFSPGYRNALASLLECYRRQSGKPRIGEKSPIHLFYVSKLLTWFPGAHVFCLIRDGRDVVNSMMNAPFTHRHFARHAAEWTFQSRLARTLQEQYTDNFHTVRFEDLLSDTQGVLVSLCSILGEEYESSQLLPAENSNVVPDWERGWKAEAAAGVDSSKVAIWKSIYSDDALSFLHRVMGVELKHWGYEIPAKRGNAGFRTFRMQVSAIPFRGNFYAFFRAVSDRIRIILCQLGLKPY